jgi:hypothetical protein
MNIDLRRFACFCLLPIACLGCSKGEPTAPASAPAPAQHDDDPAAIARLKKHASVFANRLPDGNHVTQISFGEPAPLMTR